MEISDVFFTIFIGCGAFQFYFPVLARNIKIRMSELGYEMQASPFWSMSNITKFWSEARNKNKEFNDPQIKKYLLVRTVWWILGLVSFIAFGLCR